MLTLELVQLACPCFVYSFVIFFEETHLSLIDSLRKNIINDTTFDVPLKEIFLENTSKCLVRRCI